MTKLLSTIAALAFGMLATQSVALTVYNKGVAAEPSALQYDPASTYVVVFGKNFAPSRKTAPAFLRGGFCPVTGAAMITCEKNTGFTYGKPKDGFSASGKPNLFYLVQKVPSQYKGRYALTSASKGSAVIRITNSTYYFDARPGTVIVLGPAGYSADQSIAQIKHFLSRNFDPAFAGVPYRPMSAAAISCTGKKKNKSCQLGTDVDPRSVPRK